MKRLQPWQLYVGLSVLFAAAYMGLLSESARKFAFPMHTAIAAAVIFAGVRMNRPQRPLAFRLLAVGLLMQAAGDLLYFHYSTLFGGIEAPFPSIADAAYLAAYPAWLGGVAVLGRSVGKERRVASWLDATVVLSGLILIEFVLLIYPYLTTPDTPFASHFVSAAYPVADVLLLVGLVRLVVTTGWHTPAFWLLGTAFAALVVTDGIWGRLALSGTYATGWIDLGWFVAFAAMATSALHPSILTLSASRTAVVEELTNVRLLAFALACLIPPALFFTVAHSHVTDLSIVMGSSTLYILILIRLAVVARDLGESRRLLRESRASRDLLLRDTLRASDAERDRVASALHDGPVQRLSALSMRLDAIAARTDDDAAVRLTEALSTEIATLRRMMNELRPTSLEHGLQVALEDLARMLTAGTAITVDVRATTADRACRACATIVYRIATEAITNAMLHANPSRIDVSLTDHEGHGELEVSDDGVGFDPSATNGPGLEVMREYAEMTGGGLWIRSAPGRGTTVTASLLPIPTPLGETA